MIRIEENCFIKERHTFRMPVYARWFVEYDTVGDLISLLHSDLLRNHPFLPIGGGSNLPVVTQPHDGVPLHSVILAVAVFN